uniref:Transmembrane protease serine 12 n=1 Tax=Aceria tosichella TaxID=561515 RepID=A0A6G1S6D5_9ACAR
MVLIAPHQMTTGRIYTSRLLLLVVLVNYYLLCNYCTSVSAYYQEEEDGRAASSLCEGHHPCPPKGRILLDLDSAFTRQLTILFGNNIQLTSMTLKMLDAIPTNKHVVYVSKELIKLHYPKGSNIKVRSEAGGEEQLDGATKFNPYRAVLMVYLGTIHKQLDQRNLNRTKVLQCDIFERKTFLKCCKSPCPRCKEYLPSPLVIGGQSPAATAVEADKSRDESLKKPAELWLPSWFFTKGKMKRFLRAVLAPYSNERNEVKSLLEIFLGTVPKLVRGDVDEGYYRNMLSLLASLGIPMSSARFHSRTGPQNRTEPGLLPLMSRLSLLYILRYGRVKTTKCKPLKFCQLATECPSPPAKLETTIHCLRCANRIKIESSADDGSVVAERGLVADIMQGVLTIVNKLINHVDAQGPKERDKEKVGELVKEPEPDKPALKGSADLVDADKLRLDYKNRTGVNASDIVDEHQLEQKTIECDPRGGRYSCKFRDKCGQAPLNSLTFGGPADYIINGEDQIYGEWPSFVRLDIEMQPNVPSSSSCGGVLVTDRHILTAAHCVYMRWYYDQHHKLKAVEPKQIRAVVGEHRVYSDDKYERAYKVKSVCASKKYEPAIKKRQPHDDWALIELAKPVRLNNYTQPACLPFEPIRRTGKLAKCFIVGAGVVKTTSDGTQEIAEIVQKLRVEQVSCRAWKFSDLDRSRECYSKANRQKGDSCAGDSGGPVLCLSSKKRWTMVASVSYGTQNCDDDSPQAWVGVYARIRTLLSEIKELCNF